MSLRTIDGRRFLTLTWSDIESLVEKLSEKISKKFSPDVIVGILRGGMIIANLLSDFLNVPEVYAIGCKSYLGVEEKGSVTIYQHLPVRLDGKLVLLVDDVADSGDTMRYVTQYLEELNPKKVMTATLHIKPHTTFFPDFYVDVINAWIVYPWELNEFVRVMAPIMLPKLGFFKTVEELRKVIWKESIITKNLPKSSISNREINRT